ncbi:MAG TPA: lysylphosphatidylglycerol synthase domain-containing protein [Rhizomicrobium sp.]|nr:lysylphosphatidylglycerol synthase domain-containing protein [Rhizomicrobium sp.]
MPPERGLPSRSRGAALISIGLLLLAGIAAYAGIGPVTHALAALGALGLAVITVMHLPVILAMGLAWWCIGRGHARLGAFVAARLGRDAVAEVMPLSQIGGFLAGARLLTLAGTPAPRAASSLFADLIAEFAAKLVYTLLGLAVLAWILPGAGLIRPFGIALAAAGAAFAAAVLFYGRFKLALQNFAARAARKFIAVPSGGLDVADVFTSWGILPSFVLHLICWLFGAVEAWIMLRLMGLAVSGGQAFVIDSLATAFRSLGFLLPASLGVQEAGYVLVCALFGLTPAAAVAFSLGRRARDILIGLLGLVVWQRMEWRPRSTRSQPQPDTPLWRG